MLTLVRHCSHLSDEYKYPGPLHCRVRIRTQPVPLYVVTNHIYGHILFRRYNILYIRTFDVYFFITGGLDHILIQSRYCFIKVVNKIQVQEWVSCVERIRIRVIILLRRVSVCRLMLTTILQQFYQILVIIFQHLASCFHVVAINFIPKNTGSSLSGKQLCTVETLPSYILNACVEVLNTFYFWSVFPLTLRLIYNVPLDADIKFRSMFICLFPPLATAMVVMLFTCNSTILPIPYQYWKYVKMSHKRMV